MQILLLRIPKWKTGINKEDCFTLGIEVNLLLGRYWWPLHDTGWWPLHVSEELNSEWNLFKKTCLIIMSNQFSGLQNSNDFWHYSDHDQIYANSNMKIPMMCLWSWINNEKVPKTVYIGKNSPSKGAHVAQGHQIPFLQSLILSSALNQMERTIGLTMHSFGCWKLVGCWSSLHHHTWGQCPRWTPQVPAPIHFHDRFICF